MAYEPLITLPKKDRPKGLTYHSKYTPILEDFLQSNDIVKVYTVANHSECIATCQGIQRAIRIMKLKNIDILQRDYNKLYLIKIS